MVNQCVDCPWGLHEIQQYSSNATAGIAAPRPQYGEQSELISKPWSTVNSLYIPSVTELLTADKALESCARQQCTLQSCTDKSTNTLTGCRQLLVFAVTEMCCDGLWRHLTGTWQD